MNKRFGKNDIIFLAIIIVIALLCFGIFKLTTSSNGNYAMVTVDGEKYGEYPLDEDVTVEIKNKNGNVTNILTIKDGCADMIEVDCPDKLCVKQKQINKNNETIICLPNKVVVTIVSDSKNSEFDAIAN